MTWGEYVVRGSTICLQFWCKVSGVSPVLTILSVSKFVSRYRNYKSFTLPLQPSTVTVSSRSVTGCCECPSAEPCSVINATLEISGDRIGPDLRG